MTAEHAPGAIVLFGSGETSTAGRTALRWLVEHRGRPGSVAVLETPAGFEPNAAAVARRWTHFLAKEAEVRGTKLTQLPLRRRGAPDGLDDEERARPILDADLVVLGAGSPSYTVRQLGGTAAWRSLTQAHLAGASLFLASASAIAVGTFALPVYEIYKVGEDLHWKDGLRLFELHGLALAVVTHWDNTDGGAGLDTSRCFMGQARFEELLRILPRGIVVLGIDEHTALALDPASADGHVMGRGGVTILRDGAVSRHEAISSFPLSGLGPFSAAGASATAAIRRYSVDGPKEAAPAEVRELVASRQRARAAADWAEADRLRAEIAARGWDVEDTRDGTRLLPRGSG